MDYYQLRTSFQTELWLLDDSENLFLKRRCISRNKVSSHKDKMFLLMDAIPKLEIRCMKTGKVGLCENWNNITTHLRTYLGS
jgi:hypothetical protein